ncbi:lamin tail domain-containing protein [Xanthomonas cerealis]|uniref:lamin tail domain-containing protein n=1 Tax=Xanthomonas cerealis TaxID=3390025 RepID=UPI0005798FE8|nr:lamin tail domain-containing protein [Xanthomonas translucens]UKE46939.1 lamin tail domain-containing protein [Xanthomonas translucens pv. cerealis]
MRTMLLRAAALSCALACACAGTGQAQVVISQVYGGGGNSGAIYKSDFVELHNNGNQAVSLAGWSLQYASAAGSSWQVTTLAGSIAAGGYYLVKQADGSGGSAALPAPDATGTTAMSGTAGKLALSNAATALSGACPAGNVDFVGYGSSASCAEGSAPSAAPSNTLAVLRGSGGCSDSDNNNADFATAAPTPRNSAAAANLCGGGNQPVASVANLSRGEGDSGSSAFVFTIALSQPAGSGGVSFSVATRDGSASAGSDYQALAATDVSIAAGESSAQVSVVVNGDTANEPDETFSLDISGISGALPAALTASGVILNDDFNLVPIHSIQGSGARSPLVGQIVATSGIVTARRSAGFFLQAPDAQADADTQSSEGIYVYTGSAPPAEAAVGNAVRVQASVLEYVPSADPTQPPLTELGTPTVLLQSTGNPLPAAVTLTTRFPDPNGTYDQLERLEGMRVTVPSLTVNAPTGGSVNETNASASSNGVFHAVVSGLPRAWRTAGVQQPDPLPAGSPSDVPRWNSNPQVIAVGSAGLGGERIDVASGCVVLGVSGPLDYSFRRYTIYPETAPSVQCNGADQPKPAPAPQADDVNVATYNMERFFDDQNDPAIGEPVLTAAAYQARLNKASMAIRNYLNTPDILGTVEVESLSVLQTLAARINADALAAGQPDPQYVAYLQEGNDVGGIDVGFLVKTAAVGAGIARVEVLSVSQEGKATTWTEPSGGSSLLNDRPPLLLKAIVHCADGRTLPLTVVEVHQRSLNGAETDDASGLRIRAKRQAQAVFLANLLQARQAADPGEQLLVMGDFNAFEFNDGYVDAMGTVTGLPSADAQTVVDGDGADLATPDLYNLTLLSTPEQSYSYAYDGNVQSLDHILANRALMNSAQVATLSESHARLNADFPATARNAAYSPARLSDHDPAMVLLTLKPLQRADLSVTANAATASVYAGDTIRYRVQAGNAGPDAACFAAVAFALDAAATPTVTAAPGWTCAAPDVAAQTVVTCTTAQFAAGAAPRFEVALPAGTDLIGRTLTLAASVATQTEDPNGSNNGASTAVAVLAAPAGNLALRIDGPATLPLTAFSANYRIALVNHGNAPVRRASLSVSGNPLSVLSPLLPPHGWQCVRQAHGLRSVQYQCGTRTDLAPGASTAFTLTTPTRPLPADRSIVIEASANSASADADPSDNAARFSTRIGR